MIEPRLFPIMANDLLVYKLIMNIFFQKHFEHYLEISPQFITLIVASQRYAGVPQNSRSVESDDFQTMSGKECSLLLFVENI